ncbi:retropepsin-like aspartic protease family protein [Bizionia myxarmorum]|uniref:TIGR02281 family clan AA aspartic protease n=1 Tax=Bizionia myxarmorum TaxID=291186 RepID=A0A5D0QTS0_9FLAO|nr:retropepsin-like aspartic protease [Bizionia myxarmorum]TYB72216.1 TIGR02281 family clan AA aspartic protease [Bizionia myxarmorum]
MKKNLLLLFAFLLSLNISSQVTIKLDKVNGVYKVPCKVNGIPMEFIFDTGATNVTISITEALFLSKQGLLKQGDIKESVNYQIANGEIKEGTEIILRKIEIEGLEIRNVTATVVHEQNAPLLLGMTALSKLGKISIENNYLIINDIGIKKVNETVDRETETQETIEWINSKFVEHQFESDGTKQVQYFDGVKEIKGNYYLVGTHIQETTKPWGFTRAFFIPLNKINNIEFIEKQSNYWLEVKIKNSEEAILITKGDDNWSKKENIAFMLDKSIDEENLRPRLTKAFEYLMELYGNTKTEKF